MKRIETSPIGIRMKWSIDIQSIPEPSYRYIVFKRVLDIIGALFGLALLLFLLIPIAIAIYLDDQGPIFYHQKRIGRFGKPFTTYKIRSMRVDADAYLTSRPALLEQWQRSGKLRDDPRITRVGHFLRRTSIDELPQMWNILRGEMSLIGPRAIQASEIAHFGQYFALRQLAKPGLTGLWQISGRSDNDGYEKRCYLDCSYVLQRSISYDLSILFKTIPVIIKGTGAY